VVLEHGIENAIIYSETVEFLCHMNDYRTDHPSREREDEIISILVDSSLYQDMSTAERQKLLNYLVASYFQPSPVEQGQTLPGTIRFVPEV
jgi:hypothetical protein